MKSFRTERQFSYKKFLYQCGIFLAAVAIIVYFLPREGQFNYQFDINKPWKYGLLQASFDFPIYKGEDEVKQEQDSIMKGYHPYFQLSETVVDQVIAQFESDYRKQLRQIIPDPTYSHHIERMLRNIYEKGVMPVEQLAQLRKDSILSIQIVYKNTSILQSISEIYSTKQAYEALINSDTVHYSKNLLQRCNLNNYLTTNLIYDANKSESAKKDLLSSISWANGFVMNGQKIIDRGEIVNPETYNILESLKKESEKRSQGVGQKRLTWAGQLIYVSIFMLCFMLYLDLFRKDYYNRKSSLSLLFALVMIYCVVTATMMANNFLNVYILPYAMLPMVIRVFLDSRTAFITHVITILICSICLRYPHEFILLQITAGLVAIYSLRELSQRSQLFKSAVFVILTYALLYFAFEMITENDLSKLNGRMYIYFIINGILLLFTYPLLFLLEKTFGFTSNVTLVELSNINTPLLRRMSETVPGTFQHSMQVANLAAEAANRIGAKSQLVRTGALYHDIGKMENPVFFTENQQGGINPHKNLSYEQSAQMVISHVTGGLKLADKNNLPKVIKDFIATHHGKGKTKYFYISWKNEHPGQEPDEAMFTYPGPNPFTKEQAILMMADAVEAASRSLPEYTETSISNLVNKIIDSQVDEGYFKECPITFKDIATVKEVFKEKLKTIYHTRISYPELKKEKEEPQKQA